VMKYPFYRDVMLSHWVTQLHGVRSGKNGYLSYTTAKSKISHTFPHAPLYFLSLRFKLSGLMQCSSR